MTFTYRADDPPPERRVDPLPQGYIKAGGMDRYRRMKRARDEARAKCDRIGADLDAMKCDRDRLAAIIRDLTHGDPL